MDSKKSINQKFSKTDLLHKIEKHKKKMDYIQKFLHCADVIILGVFSYVVIPISLQHIASNLATPIKNQKQLEQILQIEKKKLGIKDKYIDVQFGPEKNYEAADTSYSRKIWNNKYKIVIHQTQRNEAILRHEVYHIADGHLDSIEEVNSDFGKTLDYFLLHEPQASLYGSLGLKL